MKNLYEVVWGDDESGIWNTKTNKQVVSDWGLRRWHNTDTATVARWSQKGIAALVKRHQEQVSAS